MKKIISILLCLVMVMGLFTGCKKKTIVQTNIVVMDDLNAATTVNLMEANEQGTAKVPYEFEVVSGLNTVIARMGSGEADIAIVPAYVATMLYNKTKGGVKVCAIGFEGELSIIENGESVKKLSDLKGKEIYISGRTSDTGFIFKYILTKNGLDPENDVKIVYVSDDKELSEKLTDGSAKLAVVGQPTKAEVILKNAALRSVMNLKPEWNFITENSGYISGCVVVTDEFAAKNEYTLKQFLKEYEESVDKAASDLSSTASLCEKYEVVSSAEVAKSALKAVEIKYVSGSKMKTDFKSYINSLHKVGMKVLGTKAPGANFYYGV